MLHWSGDIDTAITGVMQAVSLRHQLADQQSIACDHVPVSQQLQWGNAMS